MSPSLVAVMAHPDDIEIHIAGTLCHLKDRGYEIHFVTVCSGDVGSMTHTREEIARIRRGEAEASARLFGATYDGLGVGDLRVTFDHEIKTKIVEVLRRYRADVVMTHAAKDYMSDHEITSALTREACFAAPAPNWPVPSAPDLAPLHAIPELYYADPTSQHDADGNFVAMPIVVDVGSVMARKEELLKCHASQRDWLRSQHGEDNYINTMREWARLRGGQVSIEYGEGFRQHRGHPFPTRSSLVEDLKPLIHQS